MMRHPFATVTPAAGGLRGGQNDGAVNGITARNQFMREFLRTGDFIKRVKFIVHFL